MRTCHLTLKTRRLHPLHAPTQAAPANATCLCCVMLPGADAQTISRNGTLLCGVHIESALPSKRDTVTVFLCRGVFISRKAQLQDHHG